MCTSHRGTPGVVVPLVKRFESDGRTQLMREGIENRAPGPNGIRERLEAVVLLSHDSTVVTAIFGLANVRRYATWPCQLYAWAQRCKAQVLPI